MHRRPFHALMTLLLLNACGQPATSELTPEALSATLQAVPGEPGSASPSPSASPSSSSSPSPSPSPSASASPPNGYDRLSNYDWRSGDAFAFEAAKPGRIDRDIFIYNERLDTVFEMVGANTPFDESYPYLANDNRFLTFQRARIAPDGTLTHFDVLLLNTVTQRVNTLDDLNTEELDEMTPYPSGNGRWIVYTQVRGDYSRLHLYEVLTRTDSEVAAANHQFPQIVDPTISSNARQLAFAARTRLADGTFSDLNLYIYDLPSGVLVEPANVNTRFDEDDPSFNGNDKRLAFDSNRYGTRDIFESDLVTHYLDDFPFLNTREFDEVLITTWGPTSDWLRYRVFPKPDVAPNFFLLRNYRPVSGVVDTLPTANRLLEASFLTASP